MFKDKGVLKACWVGMYILCAVLGFLQPQQGGAKVLLQILALLFFLPPAADLYFSWKRKDQDELRLIRNISLLSLGLTMVLLVCNVLCALTSNTILGEILHYALVLASVPFVCGQYSVYSLLLWAILLWSCLAVLRKK